MTPTNLPIGERNTYFQLLLLRRIPFRFRTIVWRIRPSGHPSIRIIKPGNCERFLKLRGAMQFNKRLMAAYFTSFLCNLGEQWANFATSQDYFASIVCVPEVDK